MKIHHLNCGTLKPVYPDVEAIVYCLLVETDQGLVLVDTGFGSQDFRKPSSKMRFFLKWMGVPRDPEECAINQVKQLGFRHYPNPPAYRSCRWVGGFSLG